MLSPVEALANLSGASQPAIRLILSVLICEYDQNLPVISNLAKQLSGCHSVRMSLLPTFQVTIKMRLFSDYALPGCHVVQQSAVYLSHKPVAVAVGALLSSKLNSGDSYLRL